MENGEEKSWEFVREETTRKTKREIWRMERLKAINKMKRGSVYGRRVKGKRKKLKDKQKKSKLEKSRENAKKSKSVCVRGKDSFSKEKGQKKKMILMIVCVRKVERKR